VDPRKTDAKIRGARARKVRRGEGEDEIAAVA